MEKMYSYYLRRTGEAPRQVGVMKSRLDKWEEAALFDMYAEDNFDCLEVVHGCNVVKRYKYHN